MPTDLPRDVILFSTADWDHPFWTNKQHVARGLAERGFRVLYVESLGLRRPTAAARDLGRIARRLRRAGGAPRKVASNLWVASPLAIPFHERRLARRINRQILGRFITGRSRQLGFDRPIVWTYNPLVISLVSKLAASLLVYHCVDDLTAAPHLPAAAIGRAESQLAREADVIFATSLRLQARMAAANPLAAHHLPNVADFNHFSRALRPDAIPDDLAAIPRPRIVGLVGALSGYKVDFKLIAAAARARPAWQWVLIGQPGEGQPETSLDALRLPNVHLLGPRPYASLPDYLRGFDVATIPSAANAYTAAMFPMKFFEYLSAGLPVVAAHTPALEQFGAACAIADSVGQFVAAIDGALTGKRPNRDYCLQLARRHTWQWRMDRMLEILESAWQARRATEVHVPLAA